MWNKDFLESLLSLKAHDLTNSEVLNQSREDEELESNIRDILQEIWEDCCEVLSLGESR